MVSQWVLVSRRFVDRSRLNASFPRRECQFPGNGIFKEFWFFTRSRCARVFFFILYELREFTIYNCDVSLRFAVKSIKFQRGAARNGCLLVQMIKEGVCLNARYFVFIRASFSFMFSTSASENFPTFLLNRSLVLSRMSPRRTFNSLRDCRAYRAFLTRVLAVVWVDDVVRPSTRRNFVQFSKQ